MEKRAYSVELQRLVTYTVTVEAYSSEEAQEEALDRENELVETGQSPLEILDVNREN